MRRIMVYGVTGAGKSTLARRIGERLGLPYHPIDDLAWEPGWTPVGDDVQRGLVEKICAGEEWVIDSGYAVWVDVPLARANLIVGLDLPRRVSWLRLLRRTLLNITLRRPLCNGNYETWRGSFLARDAIIWLHFGSFSRKRRRMRAWHDDPNAPETVLLRSPAEVDRWLSQLQR